MNLYRQIPQVDLLKQDGLFRSCVSSILSDAIRIELDALRQAITEKKIDSIDEQALKERIRKRYNTMLDPSLESVVNATGVILHTNLGRAPIDEELFEEAREIATGYCNLEYDLEKGKRGDRHQHLSRTLCGLLGCEEALVVNNNAAAVFLILNTFAKGKEAVVSRGELVEIGGSFRIPEVMNASGARLKEIGTTNKTHLRDYEAAIGEETAMLMKVHKSNYAIEGFSAEVEMAEISRLARSRGLIDYYDLGSAYLPELPWGLGSSEPSILRLMKEPPSLMSFSGDKLFGAVQAGIIVGKKALVDQLKRNQILRMFRVDKLTLALLERTALAYRRGEIERIAIMRMLFRTPEELEERAGRLAAMLAIPSEIRRSETYVGGGTLPNRRLPSVVLALEGDAQALERHFRSHRIVGRIESERFVLDLRTIAEEEFEGIAACSRAWEAQRCAN